MTQLEAAHRTLEEARETLGSLLWLTSGASPDTLIAVGVMLGQVDKAKALVGRDIDDANAAAAAQNTTPLTIEVRARQFDPKAWDDSFLNQFTDEEWKQLVMDRRANSLRWAQSDAQREAQP